MYFRPKHAGVSHVLDDDAAAAVTRETYSQEINASAPAPQLGQSFFAAELTIIGDLSSTGDIQIESSVKGNVRARLLMVGQQAVVEGEIIADDVVIKGQVTGTVRGLKVRLTSTARVKGDIIRKVIAIEPGADLAGSVRRVENPLSSG